MRSDNLPLLAWSLTLAALLGCGDGGALTGSVTYNGQPVAQGSVAFHPVGGRGTPFGAAVVAGRYQADKVYAGQFHALVRGTNDDAPPPTREQDMQGRAPTVDYIPEDAAGNGQQVTITGEPQTLDFAITGPPRQK